MKFDRTPWLAAACLLPAFLLPSAASAQSFQGIFTGEGVMMTLQPSRGQYYGTLVFDDGFYSIEAVEEDGELNGSFNTPRGEFDFKAVFRDSVLELETNSITYVLRRAGQGAEDDADPEIAANDTEPSEAEASVAESPTQAGEPASPEETSERTEPVATSSGVIYATDFEQGSLPAPKTSRPTPPRPKGTKDGSHGLQPVDAESAVEAESATNTASPIAAGGPVDEALVGSWQRGTPASGSTSLLATATDLQLTAAGAFATSGTAGGGLWKAEDQTLLLQASDAEDWQPYCRYKLVGDSLLCTFGEDSRELWFRR